jgi:hypothetical protein
MFLCLQRRICNFSHACAVCCVLCRHTPTLVDGLWALPVVQLAAGDAHSAALTSSGHMFVWGSNHFGQLGLVRDGDPNSLRARRK